MTRNAERVLFIVDRIELAKQTLEDFDVVLAEYKPILYKTARRRPGELLGSVLIDGISVPADTFANSDDDPSPSDPKKNELPSPPNALPAIEDTNV